MTHEKTDPILLTAICRFALDLFETEEVRTNEKFMEPFYRGTASLRLMIPYLGFDRYPDLVMMTKKYHSIQNRGKASGDSGGMDDGEKLMRDQSSEGT